MSYDTAYRAAGGPGGPVPPALLSGVLTRRFFAYLIDLVVIAILVVLFGFLVTVAGFLTFGLGWALYAFLVPGTIILYSALAIGGPTQGTVGMRMAGLCVIDADHGGRVGMVMAGLHALLFYVGVGTFLLLLADIAIGLARSDRRLGHDLLVGLLVIRRG